MRHIKLMQFLDWEALSNDPRVAATFGPLGTDGIANVSNLNNIGALCNCVLAMNPIKRAGQESFHVALTLAINGAAPTEQESMSTKTKNILLSFLAVVPDPDNIRDYFIDKERNAFLVTLISNRKFFPMDSDCPVTASTGKFFAAFVRNKSRVLEDPPVLRATGLALLCLIWQQGNDEQVKQGLLEFVARYAVHTTARLPDFLGCLPLVDSSIKKNGGIEGIELQIGNMEKPFLMASATELNVFASLIRIADAANTFTYTNDHRPIALSLNGGLPTGEGFPAIKSSPLFASPLLGSIGEALQTVHITAAETPGRVAAADLDALFEKAPELIYFECKLPVTGDVSAFKNLAATVQKNKRLEEIIFLDDLHEDERDFAAQKRKNCLTHSTKWDPVIQAFFVGSNPTVIEFHSFEEHGMILSKKTTQIISRFAASVWFTPNSRLGVSISVFKAILSGLFSYVVHPFLLISGLLFLQDMPTLLSPVIQDVRVVLPLGAAAGGGKQEDDKDDDNNKDDDSSSSSSSSNSGNPFFNVCFLAIIGAIMVPVGISVYQQDFATLLFLFISAVSSLVIGDITCTELFLGKANLKQQDVIFGFRVVAFLGGLYVVSFLGGSTVAMERVLKGMFIPAVQVPLTIVEEEGIPPGWE